MKSKKGFTLTEILATLSILAIVIAIAVPSLNALVNKFESDYYKNLEKTVLTSAKNYYKDHPEERPKGILYSSAISINGLKNEKYIDSAKAYKKKDDCSGYVVVVNTGHGNYDYKTCMVCNDELKVNNDDKKYCVTESSNDVPTKLITDDNGNMLGSNNNNNNEITKIINSSKAVSESDIIIKPLYLPYSEKFIMNDYWKKYIDYYLNKEIELTIDGLYSYTLKDYKPINITNIILNPTFDINKDEYTYDVKYETDSSKDINREVIIKKIGKATIDDNKKLINPIDENSVLNRLNNDSLKQQILIDGEWELLNNNNIDASNQYRFRYTDTININGKDEDYYFYSEPTDKITSYTISYNANGGIGAPSNQIKTHGVDLTLSSTKPTRKGYTFKEWNTKQDGTGKSYALGESFTENKNTTLYAVWTINKVTIYYKIQGDEKIEETTYNGKNQYKWDTQDGIIRRNGKIIATEIQNGSKIGGSGLPHPQNSKYINIKKIGYKAVSGQEWIGDNGKTYDEAKTDYTAYDFCDISESDCTITLYVNWTPNKVTIKFNANGGTVTKQTTDGKSTQYWKNNNGIIERSTNNKDYTDSFVTIKYDVKNYNLPNYNNKKYLYIEKTGYNVPEKKEWYFKDNSGKKHEFGQDIGYDASDFCDISESDCTITLYVNWQAAKYKLTYNNQNGSGCSSKSGTYNSTWGTLCTPTRTGYTFGGWYTGTGGSGKEITSSSVITGNQTVYAKWMKLTYEVIVTDGEYNVYNGDWTKAKLYLNVFIKPENIGISSVSIDGENVSVHEEKEEIDEHYKKYRDGYFRYLKTFETNDSTIDKEVSIIIKDVNHEEYKRTQKIKIDNEKPKLVVKLNNGSYKSGTWTNNIVSRYIEGNDFSGSGIKKYQYVTGLGCNGKIQDESDAWIGNNDWATSTSDYACHRVVDKVGNYSDWVESDIKIDSEPPSVPKLDYNLNNSSGDEYKENTWTNKLVYRQISSDESGSGLERFVYTTDSTLCGKDAKANDSYSTEKVMVLNEKDKYEFKASNEVDLLKSTYTIPPINNDESKTNIACFAAIDKAGNRSAWTAKQTIKIDIVKPYAPGVASLEKDDLEFCSGGSYTVANFKKYKTYSQGWFSVSSTMGYLNNYPGELFKEKSFANIMIPSGSACFVMTVKDNDDGSGIESIGIKKCNINSGCEKEFTYYEASSMADVDNDKFGYNDYAPGKYQTYFWVNAKDGAGNIGPALGYARAWEKYLFD